MSSTDYVAQENTASPLIQGEHPSQAAAPQGPAGTAAPQYQAPPSEGRPRARSEVDAVQFVPIALNNEVASEEARLLEGTLVPFPLFDNVGEHIVPLLPLYDVEAPSFEKTHRGCVDCCKSYTLCCYMFFSYLAMLVYPCAVCCMQCIRLEGYCVYYTAVVPSRLYLNMVARPLVDSYYRMIKPHIILAMLIFCRPVLACYAQCCQATWAPCCNPNRPNKNFKFESTV